MVRTKEKPAPKDKPGKTNAGNGTTSDRGTSRIEMSITMLPINKIRPNKLNPNRMTDEAFDALVKEQVILHGLPKPIVVTPAKLDSYSIIDGEYNWMAGKKNGYSQVPCIILKDVDKFESLRQMLARNTHGEHDPVALSRVYKAMLKERDISNRELAKILHVSEGSIRNSLAYVAAAELRNGYAPDDADERIGSLNVRQVNTYLKLPENVRDEWVDAGASLDEATKLMPSTSDAEDGTNEVSQLDRATSEVNLEDSKEADTKVDPEDNADFLGRQDGPAEDAAHDEGAPAPAGPVGSPAPSSDSTIAADDPFDNSVLADLNGAWARANRATRQKFIAGALADSHTLNMVRQMLKQGT